eukprot:m.100901 g.100901  ORF g.100901 m.100901 type:complete len:147 (+) comp22258_c0_seq1:247-687(+)
MLRGLSRKEVAEHVLTLSVSSDLSKNIIVKITSPLGVLGSIHPKLNLTPNLFQPTLTLDAEKVRELVNCFPIPQTPLPSSIPISSQLNPNDPFLPEQSFWFAIIDAPDTTTYNKNSIIIIMHIHYLGDWQTPGREPDCAGELLLLK